MTISYMMNQMKPGIIGSDTAAQYCTTIYGCVTGRSGHPAPPSRSGSAG
jgi:hypothetical protein